MDLHNYNTTQQYATKLFVFLDAKLFHYVKFMNTFYASNAKVVLKSLLKFDVMKMSLCDKGFGLMIVLEDCLKYNNCIQIIFQTRMRTEIVEWVAKLIKREIAISIISCQLHTIGLEIKLPFIVK